VEIKDQCLRAQVPSFFKQWGGVRKKKADKELQGRTWEQMPKVRQFHRSVQTVLL
jgi:protein gp37